MYSRPIVSSARSEWEKVMASGTVKIHVERILRKLSAANRVEAATIGLHYGLIQSDELHPGASWSAVPVTSQESGS